VTITKHASGWVPNGIFLSIWLVTTYDQDNFPSNWLIDLFEMPFLLLYRHL